MDATDYYTRSSSVHFLPAIHVPTLLLSAADDPFLPRDVLTTVADIARSNEHIVVEFPLVGGHVGFVSGRNPFRPFYYAEWRVTEFLEHAVSAYRLRGGTLGSGDACPR